MREMQAAKERQIGWLGVLVIERQDRNVNRGLAESFEHRVGIKRTGAQPKLGTAAQRGS